MVLISDDLAEDAYRVVRDALRKAQKTGIGQLTLRGREHLCAVRPCGDGLLMETLFYADEIKDADPLFSTIEDDEADPDLLSVATALIDKKTAPFDAAAFTDNYDKSLRALIAVDTSGSVDDAAVRALVGEVQGVLGAYPHVRATLYYADTEAYGPYDLRPGDDVPAPQGGGGTDFRPIFALLDEQEPDVLIYLTDGYGDFPAQAPRVPTLWVVPPGGLEDEGFPFGDVLRLEEA